MNTTFDPMFQPYSSNRYCVTARNGVVSLRDDFEMIQQKNSVYAPIFTPFYFNPCRRHSSTIHHSPFT